MYSKMLSYHRPLMEVRRLKVNNTDVSLCGEKILKTLTSFGWCVFSATFIITDMALIGQTAINGSFCMWKFPICGKQPFLMLSKWELGSLSIFLSKWGRWAVFTLRFWLIWLTNWCAYIGNPEGRTSSKHLQFRMALQHFHSLRRGVWCQS